MNNTIINLAFLNGAIYSVVAYIAKVNDMQAISVSAVIVCLAFTIPAVLTDKEG